MRVRSLINFRGGHKLFMLNPREEEYLQKVRDRWEEKSFNNNHQILSLLDRIICLHMMMNWEKSGRKSITPYISDLESMNNKN